MAFIIDQARGVIRRIPQVVGIGGAARKPWEDVYRGSAETDPETGAPVDTPIAPRERGIGHRILSSLPMMAAGALAGAGTPNIARGGGTDIARAGMVGLETGLNISKAQHDREIEEENRRAAAAQRQQQSELHQAQIAEIKKRAEAEPERFFNQGGGTVFDKASGQFVTAPRPTQTLPPERTYPVSYEDAKLVGYPAVEPMPGAAPVPVEVPATVYEAIIDLKKTAQRPPTGQDKPPRKVRILPIIAEKAIKNGANLEPDEDGEYYVRETMERSIIDLANRKPPTPKKVKEPPSIAPDEAAAIEQNKNMQFSEVSAKFDKSAREKAGDGGKLSAAEVEELLDEEASSAHKVQQQYEKTIQGKLKKIIPAADIRPEVRRRRLQWLKDNGLAPSGTSEASGQTSSGSALVKWGLDASGRPVRLTPSR